MGWLFMGSHYIYLGKRRVAALMTISLFMGVGIVWWLVDIFCIPGMVREHNRGVAAGLVFNMRIREGSP